MGTAVLTIYPPFVGFLRRSRQHRVQTQTGPLEGGSHVCERLANESANVVCENYFTGTRSKIGYLLGNPNCETIRQDATSRSIWRSTRYKTWSAPASLPIISAPHSNNHHERPLKGPCLFRGAYAAASLPRRSWVPFNTRQEMPGPFSSDEM